MSLFRAKTWWSAQPIPFLGPEEGEGRARKFEAVDAPGGEVPESLDTLPGEEFNGNSMCIASPKDDPEDSLILTGSLSGVLRCYRPLAADRSPEALIEQNVEEPILQLSSSAPHTCVCLHPTRVQIFELFRSKDGHVRGTDEESAIERGHPCELRSVREVALGTSLAWNFASVSDDAVFVQTGDSSLVIVEDGDAKVLAIPPAGPPGPLALTAEHLVLGSADMKICLYQLSDLRAAKPSAKVEPLRFINIGDVPVSLHIAEHQIMALCEHRLYAIDTSKEAAPQQKRLDYTPITGSNFNTSVHGNQLLVASSNETLKIYRGMELVWTTGVSGVPLALAVATFQKCRGLIVGLLEDGRVDVLFLGTQPTTNTAAPVPRKHMPLAHAEKELKLLRGMISQAEEGKLQPEAHPSDSDNSEVGVVSKLSIVFDPKNMSSYADPDTGAPGVAASALLRNNSDVELSDLNIVVSVPVGFVVSDVDVVPGVDAAISVATDRQVHEGLFETTPEAKTRSSQALVTSCSVELRQLPPKNEVKLRFCVTANVSATILALGRAGAISATFRFQERASDDGVLAPPRVSSARGSFDIPLRACVRAVSPTDGPGKSSPFQITVETNVEPVSLAELFADALPPSAGASNAVSLMLLTAPGSVGATIVAAKGAGKYRIFGSGLDSVQFVLSELLQRLPAYHSHQRKSSGTLEMSFKEKLPIPAFFEYLDAHFDSRGAQRSREESLELAADEFRAVQKRLLVRFKDTNAVPLNGLDMILDASYERVQQVATDLDQAIAQRLTCSSQLASAAKSLVMLIRLKFGLSSFDQARLESYLLTDSGPSAVLPEPALVQDWEERTETGIRALLKSLGASGADSDSLAGSSTAARSMTSGELPLSCDTTKRLFLLLVEKLSNTHKL
jgi:Bardet-Biedl syndrome 9 protein